MPTSVGFYTYGFAFLAYLFLSFLLLVAWRGRALSTLIVTASVLSTIWAGIAAGAEILPPLKWGYIRMAELLKSATWCLFLVRVIDLKFAEGTGAPASVWTKRFATVFIALFTTLFLIPLLNKSVPLPDWLGTDFALLVWVSLSIYGLLLVEQVFRTASTAERWGTKYLCLGLGSIFAYDFFMFADALLFKQLNSDLWAARGIVHAMAVPLIAISIARNTKWELGIHVSRHVVFHSITLLGAGVYLLLMATAGYFIRFYGGDWGGVIQVAFLCATAVLLITLLFSDTIRSKTRVFLSKHFFSFKYDYREQWTNFTRTLSSGAAEVPENVVRAIALLISSPAGLLWVRKENGSFKLLANWNMPPVANDPGDHFEPLLTFTRNTQWLIDLDEYQSDPGLYRDLILPEWLLDVENAWIVLPLFFDADVIGFVLLKHSEIHKDLNWEDRDLLKIAGQQAASHLAQYRANQALVNARQFEAFNRLSAYVVHDLKNILAQQSLIVSNAEKHKHKPAFVDDVIGTVNNSVQRMTRLMEQMRSGMRGTNPVPIQLPSLLSEVVARANSREPVPTLELNENRLTVHADKEELSTVFGHIVQNAQDATPRDGEVTVTLERLEDRAVVQVKDSGAGMDAEFIHTRLFKPFDSTKGLTGMGVGAFESREYIRALGGEISVESEPGAGSKFRIVIPCAAEPALQAVE